MGKCEGKRKSYYADSNFSGGLYYENYYDIAIIGGGIGGLMTAYRITEKNPSASVCIIEKGHAIEQRTCPIVTKKVDKCIKCPSCAIMEGLAGAGAFSDGNT